MLINFDNHTLCLLDFVNKNLELRYGSRVKMLYT